MDTNNHKGHRKRMREDFEKGGFKTWQKHKVLEYLLYNVIPVADTNDIAHNLIKECGGFVNVFHTSKKRLMSIDGVGEKPPITYVLSVNLYSITILKNIIRTCLF